MLEGRLELHTEYYAPLVLEAGGSVYFDSTMGHAYLSVGSELLKILSICTTPDHVLEQTLERAQGGAASEPAEAGRTRARGKPRLQVRQPRRPLRPR